jgi:hypothetical protein
MPSKRVAFHTVHHMGQLLRRGHGALVAVAFVMACASRPPLRTLPSGGLIYSSRGGTPITFRLGANQVITGVDEGVTGMRVGERRLLVVPPALSRRAAYPANTPPDSTLHIDGELIAIHPD